MCNVIGYILKRKNRKVVQKLEVLNFRLFEAAKNGDLVAVKHLVSQGADIHAWNNWALRMSKDKGHLDVSKYLISKGADNNAYGNLEIVKFIIGQGPPPPGRGPWFGG